MSGFSPAWLALREPADRAARAPGVLAACGRVFAGDAALSVCDLGAGTGASVRALAHLLPPRQDWTLVDSDADNLEAALDQLARWGTHAQRQDGALTLRCGDKHLGIRTRLCDIAAAPACWPADTRLVTASALFDLTSAAWLVAFVDRLAAQRLPLLAMLTFDGRITAAPAHPLDGAVADAFRRHQQRDKGFGPAAGPHAAAELEAILARAGYALTAGDSPWTLDDGARALRAATLDGIAAAVRELGDPPPGDVDGWLRARAEDTRTLVIGHRDVFARPYED